MVCVGDDVFGVVMWYVGIVVVGCGGGDGFFDIEEVQVVVFIGLFVYIQQYGKVQQIQ